MALCSNNAIANPVKFRSEVVKIGQTIDDISIDDHEAIVGPFIIAAFLMLQFYSSNVGSP